VDALVDFALVAEMAVVKRAGEHLGNVGADERVAGVGNKTALPEERSDSIKGGGPGRIDFKRLLDDWRTLPVNNDLLGSRSSVS
jgi:hypothetical protein